MAKTTPWTKIKAEYLQGATPKELAKKYKLTPQQVSNKVKREKWKLKKDQISHKTAENIQTKIESLSNNALDVLCDIMNHPDSEDKDKVSAARAILDVSGLKSVKQEIKADVESVVKHDVSEAKIEKVLRKIDGLADE